MDVNQNNTAANLGIGILKVKPMQIDSKSGSVNIRNSNASSSHTKRKFQANIQTSRIYKRTDIKPSAEITTIYKQGPDLQADDDEEDLEQYNLSRNLPISKVNSGNEVLRNESKRGRPYLYSKYSSSSSSTSLVDIDELYGPERRNSLIIKYKAESHIIKLKKLVKHYFAYKRDTLKSLLDIQKRRGDPYDLH